MAARKAKSTAKTKPAAKRATARTKAAASRKPAAKAKPAATAKPRKKVVKTGLTKEQEAAVAAHDALLRVTVDDFLDLVGQTFEARPCTVADEHIDKLHPIALELVEVSAAKQTPEHFRDPFCLLFATHDSLPASSDIYKLSHRKIGAHRLLLQEINPPQDNPSCIRYVEICFN